MAATTRLRKTFAYPDSDNDSEPEGIDEQEQEQLIAQLAAADAKKTENYKLAFLTLPLLSTLLYLPSLSSATLTTHALAITSLLGSAYALWILPTSHTPQKSTLSTFRSQTPTQTASPLKKYIDHLNAGLSILLALQALRAKRKGVVEEVWLAALPTVVFLLLFVVRTQLRPVDIRELEKLKYGYKGA